MRSLFIIVVLASASALANPTVYPTGTTIYDPTKAWNGYVLFADPNGKTHLIDMAGNEVHRWDWAGYPSELLDPALTGGKKGHLLVQAENGEGTWGGILNNVAIGEVDWDGELVWTWRGESPKGAQQSHDWARIPNGNTLVVVKHVRVVPSLGSRAISDEAIVEVTPDGDVVWRWLVGDHIDEFGISPEGLEQLRALLAETGGLSAGFITINNMAPIGPNKWFDGGDERFHPDNIMIDSREASFLSPSLKSAPAR